MITTRLTPYTATPRTLPWFAITRSRQRLTEVLSSCVVPSVLFVYDLL
jgi:hypothetical protein